jgi:hypothetical protein
MSSLHRVAPALGLFLLAPVTAEYLIGYLPATGDLAASLAGLLIFGPLYGGAALIIREVTRRAGRGWPTMILLAFAFGVLQAGLVDHSLFNPSFMGIEWWQDARSPTYIPALGVSAYFAQGFVLGHVIWSIGAPIAVVVVKVRAAYMHCAKAFIRSQLWKPESWPARSEMPTLGAILRDQLALAQSVGELDAWLDDSYRKSLW